jgi:membrane-bound lytic murein transglycosylase B/cell division protein FtsL
MHSSLKLRKRIFSVVILASLNFAIYCLMPAASYAAVQEEIQTRQQQIEEIQRQIDIYQKEIETNRSQARTLETEIKNLNSEIKQIELTIRGLELSINQTSSEISDTETQIGDAQSKILKHRDAIAQFIKIIYENDRKTLTEILLSNENISDFFTDLNNVRVNQEKLQVSIEEMKALKLDLENHHENLENKKSEYEKLRSLEAIEKRSLDQNKSSVNKLLKDTKGQEKKFQELVVKSEKSISAIRAQIQFLEQSGISAEDAVKYAQLAAIGAGIRPAFLLALLEVETRLGQNLGSGNWKDDMYECYIRLGTIYYPHKKAYYLQRAETEKNAFFKIVDKLGLNPDSVKVSREPSYGCGGAMGPAQFIPSTWLGYESEVANLTGHNPPSPWNFQDAFTASAIKLARSGATSQTSAGEIRAAKAYISGNSNCSSYTCNTYANTIQRKATEIAKNL